MFNFRRPRHFALSAGWSKQSFGLSLMVRTYSVCEDYPPYPELPGGTWIAELQILGFYVILTWETHGLD